MERQEAHSAVVRVETTIAALPSAVWRALTTEISGWWPDDFYAGGEPDARRFVLETHPGGRMYEDWGEGQGLVWATVQSVELERTLRVAGYVYPDFGGPTLWLGTWELEATRGGTSLRFTEAALGPMTEEGLARKKEGWTLLFGQALKDFVENPR